MRSSLPILLVAACTDTTSTTVEVQPNELGIVAIEIDQATDHQDSVFALRAIGADGSDRGSIQLTTGMVRFPAGELRSGSELIAAAGDETTRLVTRETRLLTVRVNPAITKLLAVPEIASALETVHVVGAPTTAPSEAPYWGSACSADHLNTSPFVYSCCQLWEGHTVFVRSDQVAVQRYISPYGPCTGLDGETCDGNGCYYGPNGFSRATFLPPDPYNYQRVFGPNDPDGLPDNEYCLITRSESWVPYDYPDMAGNFPNGQGCPGGDDGAGEWDY